MRNINEIMDSIDPDEVRGILKEFSNKDHLKMDIQVLRDKMKKLVQCPVILTTIPINEVICRGREWFIDQTIYKNKSEISYPPAAQLDANIYFNRASTSRHQVFYGAIGTIDFGDAHVIATTEISHLMDDNFPDKVYEYIAMGKWVVTKEINVVSLALHSDIAKNNQRAQQMLSYQNNFYSEKGSKGELFKEVALFISNEFSRKSNGDRSSYLLSSMYGDLILEHGLDGLMFPSVSGDGKTFNVALSKKAVDNCLELQVAGVTKGYKIGKEVMIGWFLQSPSIINEKMEWKDPPLISQLPCV